MSGGVWLLALCTTLSVDAQTLPATRDPQELLAAPADPVAYIAKKEQASLLMEQKRWAEAEVLLRELTAAYPHDSGYVPRLSTWGQFATALREQGKCRQAVPVLHKVLALHGPSLAYPGNVRYSLAQCHAALGETEAALDALERLVQDAYLQRPSLFDDPNFASLKDAPRFRQIVGRVDVSGLDRVQGWRRDVDALVAEVQRNNPSGGPLPGVFHDRRRALAAAIPTLSDEAILMGMSAMLAALEWGHTSLFVADPAAHAKGWFRPLAVRFWSFPEGLFITRGFGAFEDLAGAQVLKIGDVPAAEAVRRAMAAQSAESPMQGLWAASLLLPRPTVLKGLGISGSTDSAALTLKLRDGRVVTRTVTTLDAEPDDPRYLPPPPDVATPLFLRDTQAMHWLQPLPEHDAVYVQVSGLVPGEKESLPEFALRLRRVLAETGADHVILDLRNATGGNTFMYTELVRTLVAFTTAPDHRLYVLIGRVVNSAAGNLVTDLERFAQPVFVGEASGVTGNQYGDESAFVLPYSGVSGIVSGARWQLSHPWDQRRSIAPQVPVQLTAADYFAGKDPVLEVVLALARGER